MSEKRAEMSLIRSTLFGFPFFNLKWKQVLHLETSDNKSLPEESPAETSSRVFLTRSSSRWRQTLTEKCADKRFFIPSTSSCEVLMKLFGCVQTSLPF